MIEDYHFGMMTVNGQKYTSDLIIFPDKIKDSWWRKSGHRLSLQDLEDVLRAKPEILVIGTGFTGLMKVEEDVKNYAHKKGITLIVERTQKAVQKYNQFVASGRTIGAFHLTC